LASRGKPAKGSPFLELDYLYTPSSDVAADMRYFTEVLGGKLAFAIDSMGARVAKIDMTGGPPYLLLTDHLEGDRPVFVYRVADLDGSLRQLKKNGWKKGTNLEIPMGPCCSFVSPRGHRIALYELTRPGATNHFEGRKDF